MDQIISVVGATLILVAYGASTMGWLDSRRPLHSVLNVLGSGLLTYIAVVDRRVGFIILEAAWAAISLGALARWARDRREGVGVDRG